MSDSPEQYLYQWSHSPEQESRLTADGFEYAGESGRYPSRLMRKPVPVQTQQTHTKKE